VRVAPPTTASQGPAAIQAVTRTGLTTAVELAPMPTGGSTSGSPAGLHLRAVRIGWGQQRMVRTFRGSDRPCRTRPADRSLVAEDRNAGGVRDQKGPEPRVCSRFAHETVRHWQEQRETAARAGGAKAQVERLVRNQMNTSERRSNDS
jgi:hypothetical protein